MSPRRSESDRRIAAIEALVCRDVGRKTEELVVASRGGLSAAAQSLAGATSVGLITGFFVPRGDGAAPETDGPVGTALLAAGLAACVTSCDHLVMAGVSNWGAYGLMAALAALRADWQPGIAKFLTAERDLAVTQAIVGQAGAVDGVTALGEATVDGFGPEIHGALI